MSSKLQTAYKRLCKWYVYRLIDPRNGKPFYIGKGCRNRIDAHEQDALKGVCHAKCFVIKDIWSENLEIVKEKIAYFWNEQDAYDYEYELINEIGVDNLTNVVDYAQTTRAEYVRSVPFTPAIAMHRIKNLTWLFALWLRNRDKVPSIEGNIHPYWKSFYNASFRVFWSGIAEKALNTAASDKAHHEEIASLLKPFNVEITFEGVSHGC